MSEFEKLINASDLIEWIMEAYPDWCVGDIRSIVDHIDKLPSAEKMGEWVQDWRDERGYTHISGYKCTECDALYPWKTNFCPNCGARMEGREDETDRC